MSNNFVIFNHHKSFINIAIIVWLHHGSCVVVWTWSLCFWQEYENKKSSSTGMRMFEIKLNEANIFTKKKKKRILRFKQNEWITKVSLPAIVTNEFHNAIVSSILSAIMTIELWIVHSMINPSASGQVNCIWRQI